MAEQQSHKVVALLTHKILDLGKRYKEELKTGTRFDVFKSLRVKVRQLKDELDELTQIKPGTDYIIWKWSHSSRDSITGT